jgi:glutaredoxin 3
MSDTRKAVIHRMVLPDHECPYGLRARQLLDEAGFEVEEHILGSREEVEAFKSEHGLSTTPLIIIDGEQVGGASDLERYLAQAPAG